MNDKMPKPYFGNWISEEQLKPTTASTNSILIDGCNVAECPFYQYQTPDDYKMKYPESGDCEIGMAGYLFNYDRINEELEKACISNHNCHFKQLQRAKSENEKLKAYIDSCNDEFGCEEMSIIKSENEKLKNRNIELEAYFKVNEDFQKAWQELNSMHNDLQKVYQDEHCDNLKYKQALEDIREICTSAPAIDSEYSLRVMEKINEVLN